MDKIMKTTEFDKFVDLIRKRAWEYSKKWGIEYSEMESQGYLIYCECLEKFDSNKARFSTYLYTELNRLGDFARTYNRQKGELIQDYFIVEDEEIDVQEQLESRESSLSLSNLLFEAKNILSEDSMEILKWIVQRSWERKNKKTPTISMAVNHFNKSREYIEKCWNEIFSFWNNQGYLLYC